MFVATLLCAGSAAADWHDATQVVREHTNLADQIADACRRHCQGNRSEGKLRSLRTKYLTNDLYAVVADATLLNKHNTGSLFGIGGGVGYSHSVEIEAHGTLDASTCLLRIDRIAVRNDRYGLSNLARGEEGKEYRIDNCKRFVNEPWAF